MEQNDINRILSEFSEAIPSNFVVLSDDFKFSIYSETLDKIVVIEYGDEINYEMVDYFFHYNPTLIGFDLKKTLRTLYENKVLTEPEHITQWLYDILIIQHLLDEMHPFSFMEIDSLSISKELLGAFNMRYDMLSEREKMLYTRIELPLIKTLFLMEINGIGVDKNGIEQMSEEIENQLIKIGGRLSVALGASALNLSSPKQLSDLFFNTMKIPIKDEWRTKTGVSTASHVIEEIAKENPQVKELLNYRELMKIKGTYLDPLVKKVVNGKIHATFNQVGCASGRLSSASPNLQNQPNNETYDVRGLFRPRDGYSFIDADVSQIEIRVLASMSNDGFLIQAFKDGRDIHQETADKLGITRGQAKSINFGIIYGMSSYGFSEAMGISDEKAKEFIMKYFQAFPKVMGFMNDTKELLSKNGYVETLFGRRRHFPDYNKVDFSEKKKIERQVINSRIQGTAADIMKLALNGISSKIQKYDARLLITIHDEVIVEVEDTQLEKVMEIVKYEMENAGKTRLQVPLVVEINHSKKWTK